MDTVAMIKSASAIFDSGKGEPKPTMPPNYDPNEDKHPLTKMSFKESEDPIQLSSADPNAKFVEMGREVVEPNPNNLARLVGVKVEHLGTVQICLLRKNKWPTEVTIKTIPYVEFKHIMLRQNGDYVPLIYNKKTEEYKAKLDRNGRGVNILDLYVESTEIPYELIAAIPYTRPREY